MKNKPNILYLFINAIKSFFNGCKAFIEKWIGYSVFYGIVAFAGMAAYLEYGNSQARIEIAEQEKVRAQFEEWFENKGPMNIPTSTKSKLDLSSYQHARLTVQLQKNHKEKATSEVSLVSRHFKASKDWAKYKVFYFGRSDDVSLGSPIKTQVLGLKIPSLMVGQLNEAGCKDCISIYFVMTNAITHRNYEFVELRKVIKNNYYLHKEAYGRKFTINILIPRGNPDEVLAKSQEMKSYLSRFAVSPYDILDLKKTGFAVVTDEYMNIYGSYLEADGPSLYPDYHKIQPEMFPNGRDLSLIVLTESLIDLHYGQYDIERFRSDYLSTGSDPMDMKSLEHDLIMADLRLIDAMKRTSEMKKNTYKKARDFIQGASKQLEQYQ